MVHEGGRLPREWEGEEAQHAGDDIKCHKMRGMRQGRGKMQLADWAVSKWGPDNGNMVTEGER